MMERWEIANSRRHLSIIKTVEILGVVVAANTKVEVMVAQQMHCFVHYSAQHWYNDQREQEYVRRTVIVNGLGQDTSKPKKRQRAKNQNCYQHVYHILSSFKPSRENPL